MNSFFIRRGFRGPLLWLRETSDLNPKVPALSISGGGISGTLAVTTANATLAAAGEVETEGTLGVTLAAATLSAAGEVKVESSLGVTLAGATLAASGEVETEGSLALTLADATLSASGIVGDVIVGSLALTLEDAVLSASGDVTDAVAVEGVNYYGRGGRKLLDYETVQKAWETQEALAQWAREVAGKPAVSEIPPPARKVRAPEPSHAVARARPAGTPEPKQTRIVAPTKGKPATSQDDQEDEILVAAAVALMMDDD